MPDAAREQAPTPERLLDAAETLMSESGPDGVSIRAINAAAGCGPASVHYHFGSREELLEAVLVRRMDELAVRRGELLAELEARSGPGRIRGLVEALVLPVAELIAREGEPGLRYVRLSARLFADRSPLLARLRETRFRDDFLRISQILQELTPGVPRGALGLRMEIAVHIILHTLGDPRALDPLAVAGPRGAAGCPSVSVLVDFVAAGLSAGGDGA